MHNAALAAMGLGGEWRYQKLPVPPDAFEATVRALPGVGFMGANVTVPHKEAALALADEVTPAARAIGAANTLTFRADGTIAAENTDAPGLRAALPQSPEGATALVLGAGGSARAAIFALLGAGAAQVSVLNRSRDRAEQLAVEFGVRVADAPEPAHLLINCTSVGLADGDETPIAATALDGFGVVVDLVYRPGGTRLLRDAADRGLATVDGIEILVQQGARSLAHWTGAEPPLDVMRRAALSPP
jgi:shikimate dehydrogenase